VAGGDHQTTLPVQQPTLFYILFLNSGRILKNEITFETSGPIFSAGNIPAENSGKEPAP
jgi:hypothetical protein